ncbi:MAG TPA: hypothetical protein VIG80_04430 [Bacillaceae bacterium]
MFILKFSNQDCWIAPWEGDPGRTLIRESAKEFNTEAQAHKFASKIIKANSFRKFSLVVEPK